VDFTQILEIIGIFVAVVGGFKALEWLLEKYAKRHDESQKIDENSESIEAYKKKTDDSFKDLEDKLKNGHKYASDFAKDLESKITKSLENQKSDYMTHLKADKEEYLEGIKSVENAIMEMQAVYQQTIAVFDVKLENLTKQVEKHNGVIERTIILERDMAVLQQRETASEKRLREIEHSKKDDDDWK